MHRLGKGTLTTLKLLGLVLGFYLFSRFVLLPFILSGGFERVVETVGPWGPAVIIGYTVMSHVFAPIGGSPAIFLGLALYGADVGLTLLYGAGLISSVINFWIARQYGRSAVSRMVGQRALKEVDAVMAVQGTGLLILSRICGFAIFDFISYAAGLTTLSFRKYFLITVIFSAVPQLALYTLFQFVEIKSGIGIAVFVGTIMLAIVVFSTALKTYLSLKTPTSTAQ